VFGNDECGHDGFLFCILFEAAFAIGSIPLAGGGLGWG